MSSAGLGYRWIWAVGAVSVISTASLQLGLALYVLVAAPQALLAVKLTVALPVFQSTV
ncbi:MAG: hypothetical protein IPJ79_02185 [Bacteroidetes bacterium]|nr:hypothetical protein [Bacteroidota bacterium]